jgi:hypothetical protein
MYDTEPGDIRIQLATILIMSVASLFYGLSDPVNGDIHIGDNFIIMAAGFSMAGIFLWFLSRLNSR